MDSHGEQFFRQQSKVAGTEGAEEGGRFNRRRLFKGGVGFLLAGLWVPRLGAAQTDADDPPPDEITAVDADTDVDANGEAKRYCVYQITKITAGGAGCPFGLLDTVCVDCPPAGNCLGHASVGVRRWVLWSNAARALQICSGEWVIKNTLVVVNGVVVQANCEDCPAGSKQGYQFI